MNITRWSVRLPGTQRRNAAPAEPPAPGGGVPAARAELADEVTHVLDALSVHDMLGQVPALIAVTYGPAHRIGYVNDAYADVFGPRKPGDPAREALPELAELGILSLMDQVLRSGKPRTVKARGVATPSGQGYFTFTCTPIQATAAGVGGVLVFAADVTDQFQSAERLRESERRVHDIAVTLQRSLLPQELEQPDDLRVAATYQPGGTDAAVGGDWYDVITLGAGRTALVIGDVMGRGVRAAAVMGQLRTAVRAYARLDLPRTRSSSSSTASPPRSTPPRSPPASTPSTTPAKATSPTPPPATSPSSSAMPRAPSTAPTSPPAPRSAPAAGCTPPAPSPSAPAPPPSSTPTASSNAAARTSTKASPPS